MMDRREILEDPEETLRVAQEGHQAEIWTAIPGIVSSVDLAKQTLSVQPAILGENLSAEGNTSFVKLPLLVDVPICYPRGGGYVLTFPIVAGDEVLVIFSSRCIDSWWQTGGVQKAAEFRMHDLSDGFAILAPTSQPKKIANVSSNGVELRDEAGANSVKISGGIIALNSTSQIILNAPSVIINGINFNTHKHTGVQTGVGNTGNPF
jgi:Phage protein Gp138 N-terminal domain/GpV Apex motif